jgi:hypothetical protein
MEQLYNKFIIDFMQYCANISLIWKLEIHLNDF